MCMKESTLKRQGEAGGEEAEFKRPRPVPLVRKKQYSNMLADCVKTFCCECDQAIKLSGLRKHINHNHKYLSIMQYKELYGDPKRQIIQMVYHTCTLCKK